MLSKKDIEELATGAVKRYFNTCNLVSPQIQENDKTPDWDGELNLYENKKDIRKNLKSATPFPKCYLIKRNGLLIRKTAIKSSRPFQYAYCPLTP